MSAGLASFTINTSVPCLPPLVDNYTIKGSPPITYITRGVLVSISNITEKYIGYQYWPNFPHQRTSSTNLPVFETAFPLPCAWTWTLIQVWDPLSPPALGKSTYSRKANSFCCVCWAGFSSSCFWGREIKASHSLLFLICHLGAAAHLHYSWLIT